MYELKSSKSLNWDFYGSEFPDRYTKESKLDFELHKIVSDIMVKDEWTRILDVGGGPNYTAPLRRLFDQSKYNHVYATVDLLDPFVKPNNINEEIEVRQVDWDYISHNVAQRTRNSDTPYDLIICRGALNYLTLDQIKDLSYCLRTGGLFMANSFMTPNEISREITTGGGSQGMEEATFRKEGDLIIMTHKLSFGDDRIEHESYYHDPMDVIRALGPEGVTMECYGTNSVLYKYKK